MNNKQLEMMAREHDLTALDTEFAEEVADAAAKGAVSAYQKIEDAVVGGYKKIEDGVVSGYKKIERGVVAGYKKIESGVVKSYNKIEDKFIDTYLTKDGETVEEAKTRLKQNNK